MVKLNGQTVRGNWKSRTLKVSGFAVGYAPIITLVAMNWQNYVSTPERTWSLGVSGAILVIIATFSAVGKMKTLLGSGYTTLWIAFGVVSAMMPLIPRNAVDSRSVACRVKQFKEACLITFTSEKWTS